MLVSTADGKTFTLTRENTIDHQLLDALDFHGYIHKKGMNRTPSTDGHGGQQNLSAILGIDSHSEEALRAKSGSEALHAIREVFRLGLGDPANHLVAGLAHAESNLQTHEQLTPCLEKLQTVLESLRLVVVKQESVINELVRAHSCSKCDASIVAQGGGQVPPRHRPQTNNGGTTPETTPPAPGQHWHAQSGTYLGIAPAEGDLPARHVVALDIEAPTKLNWANAVKWATDLGKGARLPTQLEAMIAFTIAKSAFKKEYHWTGTQYSSLTAFAQDFEYGRSGWGSKGHEFRVRPFRGLALQTFTPLSIQPLTGEAGPQNFSPAEAA